VREMRVTLGTKERELLESAIVAFQFNRVATPIVAGVSDVSFMVVVGTILTAFFPQIVIPAGVEQIDEIIEAIIKGIQQAREDGYAGLDYGVGPLDTPRSLVKLLFRLLGLDVDE